MEDDDLKELTGLITELGKDVVVDWAVSAAASAAVGVAVGSIVPVAGNAAGAVSGVVVGTVNAGLKIKKGKKYITASKQIVKVSKKMIEKKKLEKFNKTIEKGIKSGHAQGNPFSMGKGAEVDAKAAEKFPIKETLDNIGKQIKKNGDDLGQFIKDCWDSSPQSKNWKILDAIEKSKTSDLLNPKWTLPK